MDRCIRPGRTTDKQLAGIGRGVDDGPEVFEAGSGLGGTEQQVVSLEPPRQGGLRFGSAISGELVGFGGDDQKVALHTLEEADELRVGFLRRDVAVDEAEAERERGSFSEVGLDEFGPLGGDGFGDLGVAVSGQVGEVHLRLLTLGRVSNREEIDGAGAAGGGGDLRLLRAEERVQQARLANVGAAKEGDLRHGGLGKLCGR